MPSDNRFELRDQLLHDQLKPVGNFGLTEKYISSTGNGSVSHLGWLDNRKVDVDDWVDEFIRDTYDDEMNIRQLTAFAACPPTGRGLSWVFEAAADELCNPQSCFVEIGRAHV